VGGKANGANGGIERSEHARRNEHFARLRALNNVDLPALVYPTSAIVPSGTALRALAAQRALLAHVFDAGLNFADPIADSPAISL